MSTVQEARGSQCSNNTIKDMVRLSTIEVATTRKQSRWMPARRDLRKATTDTSSSGGAEHMRLQAVSCHQLPDLPEQPNFWELPLVQAFICVMICANSIQLGLSMSLTGDKWNQTWHILDHIFTAIFTLEMFSKLATLRGRYFCDTWNLFDFCVVWESIITSWIMPFVFENDGRPRYFSVCRMIRVLRLGKIFRMRNELLVLVDGMVASFKSMFWVALMLLIVIYSFGIIFATLFNTIEYELDEDMYEEIHWSEKHFGTLLASMLSLFGVCIGAEWSTIIWPLFDTESYATVAAFLLFIFLTQMGFLNIIIGVIVDKTKDVAEKRHAEEVQLETRKKMVQAMEVAGLMDSHGKGVNLHEFEAMLLQEPGLKNIVHDLNLPKGFTVKDLHRMLEQNCDGILSSSEFVAGVERLLYSDEFQERCSATLERNEILKRLRSLKSDIIQSIKSEMAEAMEELRNDIQRSLPAMALSQEKPRVYSCAGVNPDLVLQGHVGNGQPYFVSASVDKQEASTYGTSGKLAVDAAGDCADGGFFKADFSGASTNGNFGHPSPLTPPEASPASLPSTCPGDSRSQRQSGGRLPSSPPRQGLGKVGRLGLRKSQENSDSEDTSAPSGQAEDQSNSSPVRLKVLAVGQPLSKEEDMSPVWEPLKYLNGRGASQCRSTE